MDWCIMERTWTDVLWNEHGLMSNYRNEHGLMSNYRNEHGLMSNYRNEHGLMSNYRNEQWQRNLELMQRIYF